MLIYNYRKILILLHSNSNSRLNYLTIMSLLPYSSIPQPNNSYMLDYIETLGSYLLAEAEMWLLTADTEYKTI